VHARAGLLCFDHVAVTHVHRDVLIAVVTVEQQVAGFDVIERYPFGVLVLSAGVVREVDASGLVGEHDEPRAVNAAT